MSVDPLAEIVTLLQPTARFSKLVEGAGRWRTHREAAGEPFYCAVLEGGCRVRVNGQAAMTLQAGDFVLAPTLNDLVTESLDPPPPAIVTPPHAVGEGCFRIGRQDGPAETRMRVGHCDFGSPDAALLIPLLPQVIVASEPRLAILMQLVGDETRARRPARELVVERLLEVLLIEALRCGDVAEHAPGLVRGLADDRLALALCAFHARPGHPWTVEGLAAESALSRSAFFARFNRTVGLTPMDYVLTWRMALAKRFLRQRQLSMEEIAERVGYSSASTFSVAFARRAGAPPARYARTHEGAKAKTADLLDWG